ncbi:MAG: hypothetical protein WBD16_12980 [Pyrinomonadaceae bacterium]|jgi:hypothetical protein
MEHRIETIVGSHGTIHLEDLPLDEGEKVEVIIHKMGSPKNGENPYPLRGTPYSYEDPFSPLISLEDWNVEK